MLAITPFDDPLVNQTIRKHFSDLINRNASNEEHRTFLTQFNEKY
jgi:hypothetical protein